MNLVPMFINEELRLLHLYYHGANDPDSVDCGPDSRHGLFEAPVVNAYSRIVPVPFQNMNAL
jgi:hypothetical protein